ncbi:MAG: PAS domain-containing protein, partial [Spirochaetaceae bacterium]|nr:PAS domain-containing protein [Spirochaetaceae bacterium]
MYKLENGLKEVRVDGLIFKGFNDKKVLNLIVRPLKDFNPGSSGMILVIIEEVINQKKEKKMDTRAARYTLVDEDVKRLEDELAYTKDNLQTTIEELETSNEELKSTIEELQSTNEELQSSNEELETSKEELQSLNEESTTVNKELQSRISELVAVNDDIKNLLDTTCLATIFLDIDLNVRRFTPNVRDFIHLTTLDIGRPIEHFASTLKDVFLAESARRILHDLGQEELEVEALNGNIIKMRIKPYRTQKNVIDGVVITFEDISRIKSIAREIEKKEILWEVLADNSNVSTLIVTDVKITYCNRASMEMFCGQSRKNLLGMPISELIQFDFKNNYKRNVIANCSIQDGLIKEMNISLFPSM